MIDEGKCVDRLVAKALKGRTEGEAIMWLQAHREWYLDEFTQRIHDKAIDSLELAAEPDLRVPQLRKASEVRKGDELIISDQVTILVDRLEMEGAKTTAHGRRTDNGAPCAGIMDDEGVYYVHPAPDMSNGIEL